MAENRSAVDLKKHEQLQLRLQFQPAIHEQVQHLYASYQAPLYTRIFGWSKNKMLKFTELTAVRFAMYTHSPLSDEQLQAVSVHCEDAVSNLHFAKMSFAGFAAYLTYRGRKTFRFPFYTPKAGAFFDPFAGNLNSKLMWHMARFAAYYVLIGFVAGPSVTAAANVLALDQATADPRLSDLMERASQFRRPQYSRQGEENQWNSLPRQERTADEASIDEDRSIAEQARSGWRAPSQQDSWDRIPDDIDDASPVSPSSSHDDAGNGSGSAWDRVRQGSGSAWDRVRQGSHGDQPEQNRRQGRDAWNATRERADGDSRRIGGSGENYSFSSSDGDKAVAKTQSQEEFDRLLERERRGIEQETNSGRRN